MSGIVEKQNAARQIELRKASDQTYRDATLIMFLQAGLAVGFPVLGSIVGAFVPAIRPYVAAISLVLTVADVAWLDRWQKSLLKLAARFGEDFDCTVLELPWDRFTVDQKAEPEERQRAVRRYDTSRRRKYVLEDWYPLAAGQAPIYLARFICQRSNLQYDSQLRLTYSRVVLAGSFIVLGLLAIVAAVQNLPFNETLILLTPATPILTWSWKEYYRHRDTAAQLQTLMKQARSAWDDALSGEASEEQCATKAREFQSAIFSRRSLAPLVLPWVYGLKKAALEDEMQAAAYDFLSEYLERSSRSS